MAGSRIQRHAAGDWDDSDGTIHSRNLPATAPAITRGMVLTKDAGTALKACAATDVGPCYMANKDKPLNQLWVDAMWGDDVLFYIIGSGVIPAFSKLECAAGGKLAALGANTAVAEYHKHGTKSNDPVTPLGAAADGDVIGVKFYSEGQ